MEHTFEALFFPWGTIRIHEPITVYGRTLKIHYLKFKKRLPHMEAGYGPLKNNTQ